MEYLLAISITVIAYLIFSIIMDSLLKDRIKVSKRLDEISKTDRNGKLKRAEKQSVLETLTGSVYERLISIFMVFIPRKENDANKKAEMLRKAGINKDYSEYHASEVMINTLLIGLGFLIGILLRRGIGFFLLSVFIGFYSGFLTNRMRISTKLTQRKKAIYHELPEMLDILSVSVTAGLSFDQAIAHITTISSGPLIDELALTERNIRLGKPRTAALREMADRCENSELRTFVSAVIQADEMGASLQNILKVQADSIREEHKQTVEEKAQKLSVKILIPMVLFIFPVMFIILLGPAILNVIATLSGGLF